MTVYNESNTSFTFAANTDDTVNGNDDVITDGYTSTLAVNGYKNTINASYDTLAVGGDSGLGNTVNGSGNQINVAANSHITVNGGGNRIDESNGFVTLGGSSAWADTLSGTTINATVLADSHVYLDASEVNMNLGADCVVFATGDNTNFYGSDDKLHTSKANVGGDEVTGNSNRIFVAADSQFLLYGNASVMYADDTSSMAVTGNDERVVGGGYFVTATSGSELWVGGNGVSGAADTLTASGVTAQVGANSYAVLSGDDDTVTVHLDSKMYFVGDGLNTHVGNKTNITINGKGETSALDVLSGAYTTVDVATAANVELETYNATVTLADDVALKLERADNAIQAGNSDTISILWGNTDQILLGENDSVSDGGMGTTLYVGGNVGATTISNFAADPSGVVELLNGAGGYASSQAAYSALTSDGAGGLKLSLGAEGAIDFANTAQLSAANFKIG